MTRGLVAGGILALVASAIVHADADCWIVDSTDTFIAECDAYPPSNAYLSVMFLAGDEEFFAHVDSDGFRVGGAAFQALWFTSPDCSGEGYMDPGTCSNSGCVIPGWAVIGDPVQTAIKFDPDAEFQERLILSRSGFDGTGCVSQGEGFSMPTIPYISAPLPSFTPPLRAIRNPNQVFADGFELGNPTHWSARNP